MKAGFTQKYLEFRAPGVRNVPLMLYEPAEGIPRRHVGIVLQHSDDNYFGFVPTVEMAKRGYVVAVSYFPDPHIPLYEKLPHVGAVLDYLKAQPGIEKVVLLGHSGGATLMGAYQAAAENGAAIFQGDEQIMPMPDLPPLTKADGVMFLDPNLGNSVMTLLSLDPAVQDETGGMKREKTLDLFDPENGFSRERCSYSDSFISRFVAAQGERMNYLIASAAKRLQMIQSGEGNYFDDEPFVVPGGSQMGPFNKMFPAYPDRYFSHTAGEWPLLKADGGIQIGIVPCMRTARGSMNGTQSFWKGALSTSVKAFLSGSAIRVNGTLSYDESELHGVDWDSSYASAVSSGAHIHSPMLLMGMTGSYEYIAAEHIYRRACHCQDKTLVFVEGAGHNFAPQKDTELYPGQWGDTVERSFSYVDKWLSERFV